MSVNKAVLQCLSILCIMPFLWAVINFLTGYEYADRAYGGIYMLWGVIGFLMSMACVFMLIKMNRQSEEPANMWLYVIIQLYLAVAAILTIIGIILLIVVIIFSFGSDFEL